MRVALGDAMGDLVRRFLAENVAKDLDGVLDALLRAVDHVDAAIGSPAYAATADGIARFQPRVSFVSHERGASLSRVPPVSC